MNKKNKPKKKSNSKINSLFKIASNKEKTKAFIQHRINGFFLHFPNGNTISTVFGPGSYSDNYNILNTSPKNIIKAFNEPVKKGSNTVEVMPGCSALVKKLLDATFPDKSNGSVFGHMTFPEWLKMVNILNENK